MKKYIKPVFLIISTLIIMSIIYSIGEYCGYRARVINTALDDDIPYINYFIYFYISWYAMLFLLPLIVYFYDKEAFLKYNASIIISLLITLIIFVVYPTIMIRYDVPVVTFSDKLVQLIYKISSPTKCVPSLHVVFAFSFLLPVIKNKNIPKKIKPLFYIFSIGIIFSTILIKQHLVYDVFTAIIVVLISWLITKKLYLYDKLNRIIKIKN